MVALPKPGKIDHGCVDVKNCRSITILSAFWRLWVATLCTGPAFRQWIRRTLPSSVGGVSGGDIYVLIMKTFQEFDRKGLILSLDYEKLLTPWTPVFLENSFRGLTRSYCEGAEPAFAFL